MYLPIVDILYGMERVIVLVGPPGVGKSTLVRLARDKGIYAVDIEDIHNETKQLFNHLSKEEYREAMAKEMRIKIDNLLNTVSNGLSLFGAGSYGSFFPQDKVEKVLLLPAWEVYERRWQERDANDEAKKQQAQKGEEIYNYFLERTKDSHNFRKVITEVGTPEEILELVIK